MAVASFDGRIVVDNANCKIVFFDVETTVPFRTGQKHQLLEFGAIVLDAHGLSEVHSYSTLIRPKDLDSVNRRSVQCNGITKENVANAPTFSDVSDEIHRLLDGRIWAGHNILNFDMLRMSEAFSEISRPAPLPAGIIDTYPLLKRTFGKRAGNFKLETLANYCGFGKQEHRSLADVRMNLDVLKSCATMLLLESHYPNIFTERREFSASPSTLKQSVTPCVSQEQIKRSRNEYQPAGKDFQSELSESVVESSPTVTRVPQEHTRDRHVSLIEGEKANAEVSKLITGIAVETKYAKAGAQLGFSKVLDECTLSSLSGALSSLTLSTEVKDEQDVEAVKSRVNHSSLTAHLSEHMSDPQVERAPFLMASFVSLALIEAKDQNNQFGCKKVLFHKGYPLQLLEFKTRIRFTVNPTYAFDERGKPRFSLLIEPSEPACEVIAKCDDLIKTTMAEQGDEATWLPVLRKEERVWRARISIGTRGLGCLATYTTKFYRHTSNGLEEIFLGHVDVETFRNLLPHGSVVDIGLGFDVFSINKRSGIRLLAKCITLP